MLVERKALVRAREVSSSAPFLGRSGARWVRTSKVPASTPRTSILKERTSPGANLTGRSFCGGQTAWARSRARIMGLVLWGLGLARRLQRFDARRQVFAHLGVGPRIAGEAAGGRRHRARFRQGERAVAQPGAEREI